MNIPGRRYLAILASVSLLASAGCTRQQESDAIAERTETQFGETEQRTDMSLTTAVQARLYSDRAVRGEDLDVRVENGVATLRGTVSSDTVEQQALNAARSVEGIVRVEDQLSIAQEASAQRDAANRPAATTGVDAQTPGWITTKIQAQYFADPDVKPWNVDVTTSSGGVVELRGQVDSAEAKAAAVRIARNTEGVTRVEDQLRVQAAGAQTGATAARDDTRQRPDDSTRMDDSTGMAGDPWLTAKIQSKYFLDTDVKGLDIDVTSQNGIVTLRGTVDSERERRQAMAIARNTDGVLEVRDELSVRTDTARQTEPEGRARGTTGGDAIAGIEDGWITTKVQSQYFLEQDVKGHRIDVDTRNGVVTLTGSVATDAHRQLAERIARDTDGVTRVVNQLTVAGNPNAQSGR